MASLMFTDCYSPTALRLIHSNGAFLPRRSAGQQCFPPPPVRRGCMRSSAAMVIDEKPVAKDIFAEITWQVSRMKKSIGEVPGLAVILVGDREPSESSAIPCRYVGIKPFVVRLPQDCSEEEVLESVSRFNHDPCVHGIRVQLPLPSHMDEHKILNAVSIERDVEGVHPLTIGQLAMRGREPLFVPPAPKGCIELLHRYKFEIKGKRAVVLGRTNFFGMPAALLLQREDATVTIIHSRTSNPEEITREADIVISAVGQPNMVRGSWIKPGAVVINVGLSSYKPGPITMHNLRLGLVGDICYEEVCKVASAINPLNDGLYLMTMTMLLSNTLTSAKRIHNFM